MQCSVPKNLPAQVAGVQPTPPMITPRAEPESAPSMWEVMTNWCSGRAPADQSPELSRSRCQDTSCMPLACNERAQAQGRLDSQLLAFSMSGNADRVAECLRRGADINIVRAPEMKSALHFVAHGGATRAAAVLLMAGANSNALDSDLRSPLHVAALNGHTDLVEMLINNNGSVNLLDSGDQTALHFACIAGSLPMTQMLVNHNAVIEVDTATNLQAFHYAALGGHAGIVQFLLDVPDGVSDINGLCSEDEQSALHCAASRGHVEAVALLLRRRANVDIRNGSRATPLHHAAMGDHTEVAQLLLDRKADPLAVARNNWTPLLMAFRQGHVECGRLIDSHVSKHESLREAESNRTSEPHLPAIE